LTTGSAIAKRPPPAGNRGSNNPRAVGCFVPAAIIPAVQSLKSLPKTPETLQ